MTSNWCGECLVNWWPQHTKWRKGCPLCGGGTVRRQEDPCDDAHEMFKDAQEAAQAAERRVRLAESFDLYYAEREAKRDGLPPVEPA